MCRGVNDRITNLHGAEIFETNLCFAIAEIFVKMNDQ